MRSTPHVGPLAAAAGLGACAGGLLTYILQKTTKDSKFGPSPQQKQPESPPTPEPATEQPSVPGPPQSASAAKEASRISPVLFKSPGLTTFASTYGLPSHDTVIIPYGEFITCWDSRTRNAKWVLEHINSKTIAGPGDRNKVEFFEETRLEPRFRSRLHDYVGSGFDRGHLCPASDHKGSQEALVETFVMTNISPQVGRGFNRDYWARLEVFVRGLVGQFQDVYVITGPLYVPRKVLPLPALSATAEGALPGPVVPAGEGKWVLSHEMIGRPPSMVAVPTHFFKVVVAEYHPAHGGSAQRPTTAVAAFVVPNQPIPAEADLKSFLVPLSALESVAGMKFLSGAIDLGDDARDALDDYVWRWAGDGDPEHSRHPHRQFLLTDRDRSSNDKQSTGPMQKRNGLAALGAYRHLCTMTSCSLISQEAWHKMLRKRDQARLKQESMRAE